MAPWSPVQSESSLEPMDERVGRDCNFFSCFFFCLFPFFSFSVLFCFVFEERVSLCILGHPKTHSVNHAILELTKICLPLPPWSAGMKGMPPPPHTTARLRLQFLWVDFLSVSGFHICEFKESPSSFLKLECRNNPSLTLHGSECLLLHWGLPWVNPSSQHL